MHLESLPVAFPFVPPQRFVSRYSDTDAMMSGTLFPELDLPFKDYHVSKPLPQTSLAKLMTLDFVAHELRLYLDTHPDDKTAMAMYQEYCRKSSEAKQLYESALDAQFSNAWVNSPWPWEGEV